MPAHTRFGCAIIHFTGHGRRQSSYQTGGLLFEQEGTLAGIWKSQDEIRDLYQCAVDDNEHNLRLVVIAACQSEQVAKVGGWRVRPIDEALCWTIRGAERLVVARWSAGPGSQLRG